MHYYMYEITNNINGKVYVGVHKTKNLDDGYMGSGKVIKRAIEKHGIENFTKTILERFDSQEAMYLRERDFVNEEFVGRHDVYNILIGGHGSFDYINKTPHIFLTEKRLNALMPIEELHKLWKVKYDSDPAFREKFRGYGKLGGLKNKELGRMEVLSQLALAPEAIKKRKETLAEIGHQRGSKNSNFGKMWITNGSENIQIIKDSPIPDGWSRGRKIGKMWITNGKENQFVFVDSSIPDDWKIGRTLCSP